MSLEDLLKKLYRVSKEIVTYDENKAIEKGILLTSAGVGSLWLKDKIIEDLFYLLAPSSYTSTFSRADKYIIYGADIFNYLSSGTGWLLHQIGETIKFALRLTLPILDLLLTVGGIGFTGLGIYFIGRKVYEKKIEKLDSVKSKRNKC